MPSDPEAHERLARLETALGYERVITNRVVWELDRRLSRLEEVAPAAVGTAGWIKLALAVALPLAVLMATGSVEQAKHAATLFGAP